ncbi:MAG: ParA family protein [Treponematales bacterium]
MKKDKSRTTVISFSSIKGGVGKTHIVILLARALAASGKRVLLADSDLNNSLSYHFLDRKAMEKTGRMNFRDALSAEGNNLCDYAVDTRIPGVSLIASSPYLADLRTINEKRLTRMIPTLYGHYDVFLIDCHPTYDNIVLNALHAADYVITPVLKDLFSYNAAVFLSEKLPQDVEGLRNWFILDLGSLTLALIGSPDHPLLDSLLKEKGGGVPLCADLLERKGVDYGAFPGEPGDRPGARAAVRIRRAVSENGLAE